MSQPDFQSILRTLASGTDSAASLPSADLVWQRAAVRARWEQYERATQAIRVAERAACVVCVVAGIAGLAALRPAWEPLLRAMPPAVVWLAGMAVAATVAVSLVLLRELLAGE